MYGMTCVCEVYVIGEMSTDSILQESFVVPEKEGSEV